MKFFEVVEQASALLQRKGRITYRALKREFTVDELVPDIWRARAEEAKIDLDAFYEIARSLNERKVIGRFSTFQEDGEARAD